MVLSSVSRIFSIFPEKNRCRGRLRHRYEISFFHFPLCSDSSKQIVLIRSGILNGKLLCAIRTLDGIDQHHISVIHIFFVGDAVPKYSSSSRLEISVYWVS